MRKLIIWVSTLFLTGFTLTMTIVSVSRIEIQIKPLRVVAGEDMPPAHQLSVYEAIVESSYEIMLIDERTNQTRQLTSHVANDRFPTLSPAGDQVAFVSWRDGSSEIYVIDLAANVLWNVSNNQTQDALPVWSPDGTLLAYISHQAGNSDIFVADIRRGLTQNLTRSPHHDTQPEWLSNGQTLTFISIREYVPVRLIFNFTEPDMLRYQPEFEWQTAQNLYNIPVTESKIPG